MRKPSLIGLVCVHVMAASHAHASAPDPSDPVAGRDHWAFQPLAAKRPAVGEAWSRSPIDDFVFARLTEARLKPTSDAEPRALLRRLCFQLTGLPPTPEQTRAFLDDRRPDALARLVDRLLDSPRFGERWGRHWLDLARYADSNGLDENFLFREAWRYRNWVIDALNADMPFDRFVLEQIAGDSLPYERVTQRDRQRIAAGFLVIGPKVLLGNDPKRQRMEVADEQIDTIGRTFLGLTLGCARCHDHKFEPVPTADYYALAGIFTSTEVMEQRRMLGEQRVMERLVGIGPDGEALDVSYESYWRDLPKLKERSQHAKSVLALLEKGPPEELATFLETHPDAAEAEATKETLPNAARMAAQQSLVAELERKIASPPAIPPRAMIPADAETPADESIRVSGQFDRPGETVPRGFLRVLCSGDTPTIPKAQSGRGELAHWLTDVEHGAGHLTARVLANRIWQHLIGQGLVRTVDNFGRTGEEPSHPELLDHLALDLIESGWSIKAVVRSIVMSRTFALSSEFHGEGDAVDPANQLLWRAHRRRLEPEALRDAMLSVAGHLDLAPMDSSVWYLGDQATAVGKNEVRRRTDFPCRSIYLPVIRNDLPELFEAFDFADPHATTGARPQSSAATQGLFMMNSPSVMESAEMTARRILKGNGAAGDRVGRMFDLMVNAPPTREEREALLAFIAVSEKGFIAEGHPEPSVGAWSLACQAVFSSSRFQFLD